MLLKIIQTVDIKAARFVPVGQNNFTIIDKSAYVLVRNFRWKIHKSKSKEYVVRAIVRNGKEKLIFLHRWLVHCPEGMQVHHINGNTFDNRRENLEIVQPRYHPKTKIFSEIRGVTVGNPTKESP